MCSSLCHPDTALSCLLTSHHTIAERTEPQLTEGRLLGPNVQVLQEQFLLTKMKLPPICYPSMWKVMTGIVPGHPVVRVLGQSGLHSNLQAMLGCKVSVSNKD